MLVLRLGPEDLIQVTDGKGLKVLAKITEVNKRDCHFSVIEKLPSPEKSFHLHLAIAPTKNLDRMEWMVEKLGEIGCDQVSFIKTANSDRSHLRMERLEKKAISALKQSKGSKKVILNPLTTLKDFLSNLSFDQGYVAHLEEDTTYLMSSLKPKGRVVILVGPEGDFTKEEIETSRMSGMTPISLGNQTLRTETAGLMACHFVNIINKF